VLIDAQPLVVALLSRFLFGEMIGLWGWLGLSIGLTGICLCGLPESWIYGFLQKIGVSLPIAALSVVNTSEQVVRSQAVVASGFNLQNLLHSGELLMVLSALSMSFGTILIRYVKRHADPLVATGWHMILGGIPLAILSYLWETSQVANLHTAEWTGLGYATLFGTAVTYGIFFFLAATGNVTSVSALIFLTPVFALLFSNLFLGEHLTNLQWTGVVLTLISVYLVNQREEIASWITAIAAKPQTENSAIASPEDLNPVTEKIEGSN
jgi:drug/metabolite transporter (DMT)-like permease